MTYANTQQVVTAQAALDAANVKLEVAQRRQVRKDTWPNAFKTEAAAKAAREAYDTLQAAYSAQACA